jgi:hypothetical protein
MSSLYRGPSIDASYQVSVYLAKLCQSRRFLEIDQSETRIAYASIKSANFVPINLQTWPPQAILISDWSISKNLLL